MCVCLCVHVYGDVDKELRGLEVQSYNYSYTFSQRGESEEIGEPQKIIPHRSHVVS